MKNINPTQTTAWKKLEKHFSDVQQLQLKEQFEKDPERASKFSIAWEDFYLDYSKNRITADTRDLLLELAEECDLKSAINSYFKGDAINATENRAVLHTALRASADAKIELDGENVVPEVQEVKEKIRKFSEKIISGEKKGIHWESFYRCCKYWNWRFRSGTCNGDRVTYLLS